MNLAKRSLALLFIKYKNIAQVKLNLNNKGTGLSY